MRHIGKLAIGAGIAGMMTVAAMDDDEALKIGAAQPAQRSEAARTPLQLAGPASAPVAVPAVRLEPLPAVAADHGPFAPRPPGYAPRNLSYGAMAPLASGQDVTGQRSGLPPVDLSD